MLWTDQVAQVLLHRWSRESLGCHHTFFFSVNFYVLLNLVAVPTG